MIEKAYFVILSHQKQEIFLPMLDENDILALFKTENDAINAGNENPLGKHFGFEVFELGYGAYYR
jgi:hypothetical protein